MTSIIAMTFLIGFTANEAYAGDVCEESCSANLNNDIAACEVPVVNAINACNEGDDTNAVLGVFAIDPFCYESNWDGFCDDEYKIFSGGVKNLSPCGIAAVDDSSYGSCTDTAFDDFDMCIEDCLPDPTIEKTLFGPGEIGISQPATTTYQYTIDYSGPAALVTDTVPAEFEVLCAVSGASTSTLPGVADPTFDDCLDVSTLDENGDVITITNQGKGPKSQGATKIEWLVSAGTSTLTVDIQTVESPGKGHKLTVFKPTSCGPLAINDGATAFEVNADGTLRLVEVADPDNPGETISEPVVIVGPSNSLQVEAVDGAKLCIEIDDRDPN